MLAITKNTSRHLHGRARLRGWACADARSPASPGSLSKWTRCDCSAGHREDRPPIFGRSPRGGTGRLRDHVVDCKEGRLPRDVRVIHPVGLGLDEKAIEAVSKWRFRPGMKDGQPVAVMVTIEMNFRLLSGRPVWHLERVDFKTPEGASRPEFDHVALPAASVQAEYATVSISFQVGADGVPINLHVRKASDSDAEKLIIATVRDWRFRP